MKAPEPEMVQVTVRLNKRLLNQALGLMKQTNTLITDVIERGLTSALKEHDPNAPLPPEHPAFLVANTTADEQRLIYNLLVLLRLPQLEPLGSPEFAQAMHKTRKSVIELLDSMADCREIPNHAAKATELYSRYGGTGHLVEGWHA